MALIGLQTAALIRRYFEIQSIHLVGSLTLFLFWPLSILIILLVFLIRFNMTGIEHTLYLILMGLTSLQFWSYTQFLVSDKVTGLKSLMITMGLKRNTYLLANYLNLSFILLPFGFALAIITNLYFFPDSKAERIEIILIIIISVIQLISLAFVASSLINSTSMVIIVVILTLSQILYHQLILGLLNMSHEGLWPLVLFFANSSPFEGIRIFTDSYRLSKNECLKIKYNPAVGGIDAPGYMILTSMTFWSIATIILARWLEEVNPNETDDIAPRGWFYCLKLSRSCYNKNNNITSSDLVELSRKSKYFEHVHNPSQREIGIGIKNVSKNFNKTTVVKDVTLNVYRGETTLLLGHNGAGKTTLMNIILGKFGTTEGFVIINNRESANLGFCPQSSILDDRMTVEQHLRFFLNIKLRESMDKKEFEKHLIETMRDVGLVAHSNKIPSELSGGMRRKLSLALAFVGKSQVLILDEPSSGLDPDSRMFIWDAIRRYRQDRTVLLSTQHMEEADYLGDRIAIMSEGELICCGSSIFLNNALGNCYKLRVECDSSRRDDVLSLVRKYFCQAKLINTSIQNQNEMELTIKLLDATKDIEALEISLIKLLDFIECNPIEDHGVKLFGLKSSSIEDVMLNTAKESFTNNPDSNLTKDIKLSIDTISVASKIELLTKAPKLDNLHGQLFSLKILRALVIKNLLTYRRDFKTFILFRVLIAAIPVYCMCLELSFDAPTFIRPSLALAIDKVFMIMHLIYYPTVERSSSFKIMQLSSYANPILYWTSFFAMDFLSISLLLIYANLFHLLTFDGVYITSPLFIHLTMSFSLLLFGISSALIAYTMSNIITDTKTSIITYISYFSLSPFVFILQNLLNASTNFRFLWIGETTTYFFRIIMPTDTLQYIMSSLLSECYIKENAEDECTPEGRRSPVLVGLLFLSFQCILYSSILFALEYLNFDLAFYLRWENILGWMKKLEKQDDAAGQLKNLDDDVVREMAKATKQIHNIKSNKCSVVASNLIKSYIRGSRVINNLSFTVNKGECFGLLGVNGAGKSTTFAMLSGELRPDAGHIRINKDDYFIRYRQDLGYDPQAEPLSYLDCIESLTLIARLRGLREDCIPGVVSTFLDLLQMEQHAYKIGTKLSGGTKKKLSLGMSLIGNPPIALLDEPTAGVDPLSRVDIWSLLRELRSGNKCSIVLSSHAMEECEAVCERIGIMASGRLRCVGSFLHLRNKFAQGCRLKIQLSKVDEPRITTMIVDEICRRFRSGFGDLVKLVDQNINTATFNIVDNSVKRSALMRILREVKDRHPSLHYTINHFSLEDIFIALAKEQQELQQLQASL